MTDSRTKPRRTVGAELEIIDLHKAFDDRRILKGVSLKIPAGSITVVLGGSGSGKTVLMRHLIGLLRPDQGRVLVDGDNIGQLSDSELVALRRRFGMVFQQAALFDSMNVFDNVAFPLIEQTTLDADAQHRIVREKLAIVDLHGIEHLFPAELSGGMRKRVGLARALALQPDVVLYDEPTTGLDPLATTAVDEMIMSTRRRLGVTSVVISHDIASAFRIADKIAVLDQGTIVEEGPPKAMRRSEHPFVQRFLASWFEKQ